MMINVLPKNEELRKWLSHPQGNIKFRAEGSIGWPDDAFTARRIADGDVTVVKDEPVKATK